MALSKTSKLNRLSSLFTFPMFAFVVGFFEITAQYSGMFLEKSSVPISREISMMSCLLTVHRGRYTRLSMAVSITAYLVKV